MDVRAQHVDEERLGEGGERVSESVMLLLLLLMMMMMILVVLVVIMVWLLLFGYVGREENEEKDGSCAKL